MNLAAVAANERLGSFEATTLAGGACASQIHNAKLPPTAASQRKGVDQGRTDATFDSGRAGTQPCSSSEDLMVGRGRAGARRCYTLPFDQNVCRENG